jgi:hypothetical protein
MIELVEDLKGIILPPPFKHRFAGRKNHADRYSADTAYPAYILVSQQLKYTQRCSTPCHSDLTTWRFDLYVGAYASRDNFICGTGRSSAPCSTASPESSRR